jgi:Sulfotransferase family
MKSGTRYLTKLLNSHPSIFMCDPEEPSFFVDQAQLRRLWPDMWDRGYWKGQESYLRLFQTAENATILGESSIYYTKRPLVMGVPEKIQQFNPDARFIYIMRDPVERAMSHYWHMVNWEGEWRSILDAIKEEPQYRDVSYYAMQLTPFIELFGREKINVLTLEELTRDPNETMKGLWKWLNIDCSVEAKGVDRPENVTPEIVAKSTLFGVHRRLRRLRIMRSIVSQLPPSIRQIGQKGTRLARRQINRRAVEASNVIEFLRPIQIRQTEELVQLVGRDLTEWSTLFDTREPRAVSGK